MRTVPCSDLSHDVAAERFLLRQPSLGSAGDPRVLARHRPYPRYIDCFGLTAVARGHRRASPVVLQIPLRARRGRVEAHGVADVDTFMLRAPWGSRARSSKRRSAAIGSPGAHTCSSTPVARWSPTIGSGARGKGKTGGRDLATDTVSRGTAEPAFRSGIVDGC